MNEKDDSSNIEIDQDIKSLVKERLMAMPANISFSIGDFGDFSRDELIDEIDKDSEVGKDAIAMQLDFIKRMPTLLRKYGSVQ